jgi:hypothetical protein
MKAYFFFLVDVNSVQAIWKRIHDNVCIIELTDDCSRIVVSLVFTPNDVNIVISNMSFLLWTNTVHQ